MVSSSAGLSLAETFDTMRRKFLTHFDRLPCTQGVATVDFSRHWEEE